MWSRNALTATESQVAHPAGTYGSITTPALAAVVSNAGGLGALSMWGFSAEDAERRIAGFRQQSAGSLNVNYPLWPEPRVTGEASEAMRKRLQSHYDAHGLGSVPQPRGTASEVGSEQLAMLLRLKPEVVSFHFGLPPSEVMGAVRGAGIFVICSATTVAEARILEERGVDTVIAQGTEAGRHRGTFTGVDMSMQAGLRLVAASGRCGEGAGYCGRRCRRQPPGRRGVYARSERCANRNGVPAQRGSQRARCLPCRGARGERFQHRRHGHDYRQACALHQKQTR